MKMKPIPITEEEFQQKIAFSKIIVTYNGQPKVLEDEHNRIIKVFYAKRGISSDFFYPYAKRFISNAERLKELGFLTIDVCQYFYHRKRRAYIVFYPKIKGIELRSFCRLYPEKINYILGIKLPELMFRLHAHNFDFRGIHLGNIIIDEQALDNLALIDIASGNFKKLLTAKRKIKNLKHLLNYKDDNSVWQEVLKEKFLQTYRTFCPDFKLGKI